MLYYIRIFYSDYSFLYIRTRFYNSILVSYSSLFLTLLYPNHISQLNASFQHERFEGLILFALYLINMENPSHSHTPQKHSYIQGKFYISSPTHRVMKYHPHNESKSLSHNPFLTLAYVDNIKK